MWRWAAVLNWYSDALHLTQEALLAGFVFPVCTFSVSMCVCQWGNSSRGGIRCGTSDHFKAEPSSALLYDSRFQLPFSLRAHYSGRCPIVTSFFFFFFLPGLFRSIPKTQHRNMQGGGRGGGQGAGGPSRRVAVVQSAEKEVGMWVRLRNERLLVCVAETTPTWLVCPSF